ncbi:MAG: pantetheine-phosphate adenylyltransferase [Nitrospinota bacterium]|nr:pantetheine-phosphate adenylyltransferase [Nitrospinota bacterium]
MNNVAIYPGTFDPPTNGHIDIVKRCLRMFEKVIVAISVNPEKTPMFSFDERKQFFMDEFKSEEGLSFVSFDKELLVSFSKKMGAQVIIRGLRAVSDFDYELQMTLMNRNLDESVETIFLMPSQQYSFLSSSIVKEVASLGGDVSSLVPSSVFKSLKNHFNIK